MTAAFQEEQAGGSNKETNLQALCKPCHSQKMARDTGLGGGPNRLHG
jgi:5-methylcytosine-specific restriction endonuclease McrA